MSNLPLSFLQHWDVVIAEFVPVSCSEKKDFSFNNRGMILISCCLKPMQLIIQKAFLLIYCKCNGVKPFEHDIPAAFHFLFHMLLKHIKWSVTDSANMTFYKWRQRLRTYSFGDSLLGGSRLILIPRLQWSRNQYLFIHHSRLCSIHRFCFHENISS